MAYVTYDEQWQQPTRAYFANGLDREPLQQTSQILFLRRRLPLTAWRHHMDDRQTGMQTIIPLTPTIAAARGLMAPKRADGPNLATDAIVGFSRGSLVRRTIGLYMHGP